MFQSLPIFFEAVASEEAINPYLDNDIILACDDIL